MRDPIRIIIVGAAGRMGRMLVRAVSEDERLVLVGATERESSGLIGRDAGEVAGVETLGLPLISGLDGMPEADVLIDFTAPEATLAHAAHAKTSGWRMVIGTTGFTPEQLADLRATLSEVPVVMAANFSVGVNLALNLIRQAAEVLSGDDYDAEIFEAHHRHKVDAPSGTALAMGRSIAEGRGVELERVAVRARDGITGPREPGSIGFSVVRGGSIVGEHRAMFIADEERVEITHIASDRMVFARGALRAARWLVDQPAGWYEMRDVLGLG